MITAALRREAGEWALELREGSPLYRLLGELAPGAAVDLARQLYLLGRVAEELNSSSAARALLADAGGAAGDPIGAQPGTMVGETAAPPATINLESFLRP